MSFSYRENQSLIEGFNLTIKKGQKVAIVGPTGAGKTTLINLIMRFYDPVSGNIIINGQSSLAISKQSLRQNIGMVLQDTWIFTGSILDNIRYFKKDASEEEVKEAARKARVMLLNPELVILDEATSNIDTRSEMLITAAFDQMMKEKTSIVIAHRLSTIEKADVIIVMKDGNIIETGNHNELMKKQSFYYSMYSSQYK